MNTFKNTILKIPKPFIFLINYQTNNTHNLFLMLPTFLISFMQMLLNIDRMEVWIEKKQRQVCPYLTKVSEGFDEELTNHIWYWKKPTRVSPSHKVIRSLI